MDQTLSVCRAESNHKRVAIGRAIGRSGIEYARIAAEIPILMVDRSRVGIGLPVDDADDQDPEYGTQGVPNGFRERFTSAA